MKKILHLPIVKLGKWFHPKYGTVEFKQQDLTDLIHNFEQNSRGYEPYLRYGHYKGKPGAYDDEPAEAHLLRLYQKNDVLFGIFEPHSEDVVKHITEGKYRYGSAEIVRNALDKTSGKRLSIFLKGHALTNTPFIPNLPRNLALDTQYFSEDDAEVQFITLSLSDHGVSMSQCSNCGSDVTEFSDAGYCGTCQDAVSKALEPFAKPEITVLNALATNVKQLWTRVENLPAEIAAMVSAHKAVADDDEDLSEGASPVTPENVSDDAAAVEAPVADEPQDNPQTTLDQETVAEEAPASDEIAPEPEANLEDADPKEREDMELNAELQAQMAELRAAVERLEAEKKAAESAAEEAVKLLEEKAEAERVAAVEAEQAKFALALSDQVDAACKRGVAPVTAERARQLVLALQTKVSSDDSFMLSEGEDPVDLVNGVFSLLSEAAGDAVDFSTHGVNPVEGSAQSDQPWADRIAAIRNTRSAQ